MIDVHCHMQFHKFEDDYDVVIKDAFASGITKIINAGTSIESSQKGVGLADNYEDLYAIVGVHPHHSDKLGGGWLKELEKLTSHPKVLGIGEIGLDYYSYKSNGIVDPKMQRVAFEEQIELAYKTGLPLQIHNRHAGKDVIEILQYYKNSLLSVPGMFHCFAGDLDFLKAALQMGFYIGFDGNTTYKGLAPGETVELKDLASYTPLDRIVVETDSPYLTPIPYRGQRNEPKYAIITAKFIAELKHIPYEQLVEQTDKNVYTIFSKLKS
jgi:TatD DNase family protein